MELQEAGLLHRYHIAQVLRKLDPRPTDEWIAEQVDRGATRTRSPACLSSVLVVSADPVGEFMKPIVERRRLADSLGNDLLGQLVRVTWSA